MLIRNITQDDLGFAGVSVEAGATVEVSDSIGNRMVRQCPDKFEGVESPAPALNTTASPDAGHRHYWRKDNTCRCGAGRESQ